MTTKHLPRFTNALIVSILLALGAGCAASPPVREPVASAPPWVASGRDRGADVISVPAGRTVTIDGPASIAHLVVGAGARVEAKSLVDVAGRIIVVNDAVLVAPRLRSCDVLDVGKGAEVIAPELRRAESVTVGAGYKAETLLLPSALSSADIAHLVEPMIGGASATGKGARVEAQSLERVTNVVTVGDGATMTAPSLRSCGGAQLGEGATFGAPCAATTASRKP
jgi:hypothetical protein